MKPPIATRAALVLSLTAFAVIVAGCGESTDPDVSDGRPSSTVVLGIYSGRPDPSWDLSAAQSADLARRIEALPGANGVPPEGGLGYRGFTIVLRAAGEPDRTLIAYRGVVAPPGTGARAYLADPERSIERFLLEAGRPYLAEQEVAEVEADLATE